MPVKALVLDVNILVRAVLGKRVRHLIEMYAEAVAFFVPEGAYLEAEEHIGLLVSKRGGDPELALSLLRSLRQIVELLETQAYIHFETEAKERLNARDVDEWPILASALALHCPIWTEDTDFFGYGAAIWTTDRIEIFFTT